MSSLGECLRHPTIAAAFRCRQCTDPVCLGCRAKGEKDHLRALASATVVYAANVGALPASLNNLTVIVTATGKPAFGPLLKPLPTRPNTNWSNDTYTTLAVKGTFQIISSSAKDSASLKAP